MHVCTGLYLAYAPLGSLMYDRLLAASGTPGTTVFLIFLSDATGYVGTTILLLFKNFDPSVARANWEECFVWGCIAISVSTIAFMTLSGMVFSAALKQHNLGYQELIQQVGSGSGGGSGGASGSGGSLHVQGEPSVIPGSPRQQQVYKAVHDEPLFQ